MTPESYMDRYHRTAYSADARAIAAEEVFPCCGCGCGVEEDDGADVTPQVSCCCKPSMVEALNLFCGNTLGSLVDFSRFFFLTDSLAVGSALIAPISGDTDNISPPTAGLRRLSPCNCDLLDVTGTAYLAVPGTENVALANVDQLSLCAIKAIAFQVTPGTSGDPEITNYQRAVRALQRAIQAEGGTTSACAACQAHCDCDDCCCAAGLITELATRNLSRQATLTVGPLVLQNVTVIGSIGSVLVLSDETLNRFYFVCANSVEALA